MGLIAELGVGSVAVDTAIFIYFIEENPQFLPAIVPLFSSWRPSAKDAPRS